MIIIPNPAQSYININLPDSTYNSISIISSVGDTVYEQLIDSKNIKIDINNIQPGKYVVIARKASGIIMKDFVKC